MKANGFWGNTAGVVLSFTSAHGQFAWAHRVASTPNPSDELAIGLALDRNGNCHGAGWFDGTNDFGGVVLTHQVPGGRDMFVASQGEGSVIGPSPKLQPEQDCRSNRREAMDPCLNKTLDRPGGTRGG